MGTVFLGGIILSLVSLKWLALQAHTGVLASSLGLQAGYRVRTADCASQLVLVSDGTRAAWVPRGAQGGPGCRT